MARASSIPGYSCPCVAFLLVLFLLSLLKSQSESVTASASLSFGLPNATAEDAAVAVETASSMAGYTTSEEAESLPLKDPVVGAAAQPSFQNMDSMLAWAIGRYRSEQAAQLAVLSAQIACSNLSTLQHAYWLLCLATVAHICRQCPACSCVFCGNCFRAQ